MDKKIILLAVVVMTMIAIASWLLFRPQPGSLSTPLTNQLDIIKKIVPSETLKEYSDPTGFSFEYPDNLSIKASEKDSNTYADIQLSSKEISGSLNLKITDTKLKSLADWQKLTKGTSVETKLGTLKALEITTEDRILLGAIDQGILFTIDIPKLEEQFWMKVYEKVRSTFSFVSPALEDTAGSAWGGISFEGEEVVE